MSAANGIHSAADWLWSWPNHTVVSRDPIRGFIDARDFDDIEAASAYIETYCGTRNLYFMPNGDVRSGVEVDKKANEEQISYCYALYVDLDTYKTGLANNIAYYALTENLPIGVPGPASIVNFSGGGLQGFWLLEEPWECNGDLGKVYEFKNRLLGIIGAYGSAADRVVHDACRMMRLPYTVNIPDLNKQKAGRTPQWAKQLKPDDGLRYRLEDFPCIEGTFPVSQATMSANERAAAVMLERPVTIEALDEIAISPHYRAMLEAPEHHNETEHAIIMHLLKLGNPANLVLGVITDTRWGLGQYEHVKEQTHHGNAKRQVARALCRIMHDNQIELKGLMNATG